MYINYALLSLAADGYDEIGLHLEKKRPTFNFVKLFLCILEKSVTTDNSLFF